MGLTIKKLVMTKKGNQFETLLPAKRIVCPTCEGTGRVLCDGLRGVAIDPEHMEDPDFAESYFGGNYDVTCDHCHGENVVLEVDYEALSEKMKARVDRQANQEWRDEQERLAERRWGF